MKRITTALVMAACLALSLIDTARAGAQGFGAFKMEVYLQRKRPPKLYLTGTNISIQANALAPSTDSFAERLKSKLGQRLSSGDSRLRIEADEPETIIACNVTRFTNASNWDLRKRYQSKKTGEKEVWNEKKKKMEKKDVYTSVEVEERYLVVRADAAIQFEIKDATTGTAMDSGTAASRYHREFQDGTGAPDTHEVPDLLLGEICFEIASRIVTTTEPVKVLLPKGKFEDASKALRGGQWASALETLQAMAPLSSAKDDAYRLYSIGVAYEALAYQADDPDTTRKYLEQAASSYGKAFDMKPDEKHFREPQVRIETAIQQYKILADQASAYEAARGTRRPQAKPQPSASRDAAAKPTASLDNEVIIKLVKAGLSDENVIAAINESKSNNFDLSPEGLMNLIRSGVSNRVIGAMRGARR